MLPEQYQQLSNIAPRMLELVGDPKATVGYDLFAGALMWSDEIPSPQDCGEDLPMVVSLLRHLFHYRTTIILGKPDEKCRELWEAAESLFPTWPGFDPRRSDRELRPVYKQLSEPAQQRFSGWFLEPEIVPRAPAVADGLDRHL